MADPHGAGVVVVGSSLAGLRACETLRHEGYDGRLTLVGEEPDTPYDRPPLSKKLLAGEWETERILLRKPAEFESLALELRLGARATSLDLGSRTVVLADGTALPFDGVVIATGASPKRLPGQPDVPGVVTLRRLRDSLALRERLEPGHRLVVIGAGFIGLEVAATARQRGCVVTVLEGLPAPLVRGLGAEMGTAVAAVHARHGVDVQCGVVVTGIALDGDTVRGVHIGAGGFVDADTVLVGVGVHPETAWLDTSGLTLRDGIVCDPFLNAGAPGVYGAGDLVRWPNGAFTDDDGGPEEMRIEHWTNAAEQGAAAARNLLAELRGEAPLAFESVPFFWSDQFESRLQFVGRAHGDDDVHVFAGDPSTGPFAALYGWRGRLRGVLGVSSPRLVMPFRSLLAAGASWDDALAKAGELAG